LLFSYNIYTIWLLIVVSLWLRIMISESILSVVVHLCVVPKFLKIECQNDAGSPACNLGTLRPCVSPLSLLKGCKSYPFRNTRIFVLSGCWEDVGSRNSNHSYCSSGKNGKNIIFCILNLTTSTIVSLRQHCYRTSQSLPSAPKVIVFFFKRLQN